MDKNSIPDPATLAEESKGLFDYPRFNKKTDDWDEFYAKKNKHFKGILEKKEAQLKEAEALWGRTPAKTDASELAKIRACCSILSGQVKKIRSRVFRGPSFEEPQ